MRPRARVRTRRHPAVAQAVHLLCSSDTVVGVVLTGSGAYGDADAMSDIDLEVYCDGASINTAWSTRVAVLERLGTLILSVDIPDIVPGSVIGFYYDSPRIHLTYRLVGSDGRWYAKSHDTVLFGTLRFRRGRLAHKVVDDESMLACTPARFAYWLNRAIVGHNRGDVFQLGEARLQLLGVYLAVVAAQRGRRYSGLRKVDRYLSSTEVAWAEPYVGVRMHDISHDLRELTERYRDVAGATPPFSTDVAALELIDQLVRSLAGSEHSAGRVGEGHELQGDPG